MQSMVFYKMVHNSQKRGPGRPRNFDTEAVLEEASSVFWDYGFEGTSLDALTSAMGMNRPSLYGAFGDKQALYMRTLNRYRSTSREAAKAALSNETTFAEALARLYQHAIDIYVSGENGQRGCLLICAATTDAVNNAAIRASYAAGLQELDALIEVRVRYAIKAGDLKTKIPPGTLAQLICGIMNTLAVRARAGFKRSELESIANAGIQLVCSEKDEGANLRP